MATKAKPKTKRDPWSGAYTPEIAKVTKEYRDKKNTKALSKSLVTFGLGGQKEAKEAYQAKKSGYGSRRKAKMPAKKGK